MKKTTALTFILVFVVAILVVSCGRKVSFDGTVKSKTNQPMPNRVVQLHYSEGGKEQTVGHYSADTDANGHFVFSQKIKKNRRIQQITVRGDSTTASKEVSGDSMHDIELIVR